MLSQDVHRLERILQYTFHDPIWLDRALTHSSATQERKPRRTVDNEQMEFLGDAILGFCVSDYLFKNFPEMDEGALSKTRSHLVSAANLIKIARQLHLGEFLYLGRGEEKTGGRQKRALLVDAFEALIAAVYLDGGLEPTRRFVLSSFNHDFEALQRGQLNLDDYKSQLQERLQALHLSPAEYTVVSEEGPEHEKLFTVGIKLRGRTIAQGQGETKKGAEQDAARQVLLHESMLLKSRQNETHEDS
jgi:ribonuclease-3